MQKTAVVTAFFNFVRKIIDMGFLRRKKQSHRPQAIPKTKVLSPKAYPEPYILKSCTFIANLTNLAKFTGQVQADFSF